MLITERKLRSIIRSVIKESSQENLNILKNSEHRIKEVIRNWLSEEVVGGKKVYEYAEYDLMNQIILLYSTRTYRDGSPIDVGDDIDYYCEKILDILHEYHKGEIGGYEDGYETINTYDIYEEDIENVTNKIFTAIEDSEYFKKLVGLGHAASLEVVDNEINIEEKILNSLRKDMSEEEYRRIEANIPKLIQYTVNNYKSDIEDGVPFDKAFEDAKEYLRSFYDFD